MTSVLRTSGGRSSKLWDSKHKQLLAFYGVPLSPKGDEQPKFGAHITNPELKDAFREAFVSLNGEKDLLMTDWTTLPTLTNWAFHFGYADNSLRVRREELLKMSERNQQTFVETLQWRLITAGRQFFAEIVRPLQGLLWKQSLFFYTIPAASTAMDLKTGELFRVVGPPVLGLLPHTPDVARATGTSDTEITPLAGPVLWLIHRLCDRGRIQDPKQLFEMLMTWRNYIHPRTWTIKVEQLQRQHPRLLPPEARQALLPDPEAMSRVLHLPEPSHEEERA
jgi:hypothetical protein